MDYLTSNDFGHLAAACAGAAVVGYIFCWSFERFLLRRVVQDRIPGIALSCALAFVLIMGGTSFYLTTHSGGGRAILVPALPYALSFLIGITAAGVLRTMLYSAEYAHNDDEAVFDIDWNDPRLFDEEVLAWEEKHQHRNYLARHWVGHLPLPLSYWINGALVSGLIVAAAQYLTARIREGSGSLRAMAAVAIAFLVVSFLVWVWSSVGIWRSAYWHRRRGGTPGWGLAARGLLVLSAALTLFRSSDLALQAAELGQLAAGRDPLGEVAAMEVTPDGRRLLVRGNISAGTAERFRAVLDGAPAVKEIVLTSLGGRMIEAQRMVPMIRRRGLDTRVDDYCMSACTTVLLAGNERTAPNRARIGFHQPSFPGMRGSELAMAVEEMRAGYLAAGVEPGFVARAMITPAEDMWLPSPDELNAANVLTASDIVVTASHGRSAGGSEPESLSEQRLRTDLRDEAARVNAAAPITLNPNTTLDRASASGFTLTQYYTIRAANLDVARTRANMARGLEQETCGTPVTAAVVRDGGKFIFSYRDKSGRRLFEVPITHCSGR
jgi:hypothetical protein